MIHVYRNTAVDRCAKINLPKPICKKPFFSIFFLKFHILLRETKQWHQQLQSCGRIDEACHTYRKQGPWHLRWIFVISFLGWWLMLPLDEFDYNSTKLIRIQVGQRFWYWNQPPTKELHRKDGRLPLRRGPFGRDFPTKLSRSQVIKKKSARSAVKRAGEILKQSKPSTQTTEVGKSGDDGM